MKVFVVIPVRNRWNLTKQCLISIVKQSYKDQEIVVIDDGSTDETYEKIQELFPRIKLVGGDGNLWWTGATHLGVEHALREGGDEDAVLLLNNDCVLTTTCLEVLVKSVKSGPNIIAGSIVKDVLTKKVIESGVIIDWQKGKFYSTPIGGTRVDALTGKGVLIPLHVFSRIGNFHKALLPHYGADYEFYQRAKRAGYLLKICPDAIVYNYSRETGIDEAPKQMGWGQLIKLALTKKSKINLKDQVMLMFLCCPPIYWPINLIRLAAKSAFLLSLVPPFVYLRRFWLRISTS
ncbi:hypothetical protein A3D85_01085 [Candidatus Amesbacteria bacterium RIFCSPHIGHO2_02_FULL_47_9]|uniref:Glycosyltransferase 2-like domain-containing protein n=1 Tax=Candidatus Amesbacteria bacterium RIFCSPHIGHO2_01_FULL_48_32b TaxID=1797253 RepID=A0A1F4YDA4_9BACT|nr:MAG: hypothetical protein A2876_03190 [Candidatus Amesbacteria bacterium RIFCSPHIGHO2_01_FULL_48_32b]OGD02939.1 MAG: hypothetical protein A3D85_01085 [Candidatus Amesbacteria bacterium RIFCSPHIGHO2_02_FULL_47_9]